MYARVCVYVYISLYVSIFIYIYIYLYVDVVLYYINNMCPVQISRWILWSLFNLFCSHANSVGHTQVHMECDLESILHQISSLTHTNHLCTSQTQSWFISLFTSNSSFGVFVDEKRKKKQFFFNINTIQLQQQQRHKYSHINWMRVIRVCAMYQAFPDIQARLHEREKNYKSKSICQLNK